MRNASRENIFFCSKESVVCACVRWTLRSVVQLDGVHFRRDRSLVARGQRFVRLSRSGLTKRRPPATTPTNLQRGERTKDAAHVALDERLVGRVGVLLLGGRRVALPRRRKKTQHEVRTKRRGAPPTRPPPTMTMKRKALSLAKMKSARWHSTMSGGGGACALNARRRGSAIGSWYDRWA